MYKFNNKLLIKIAFQVKKKKKNYHITLRKSVRIRSWHL